MGIERNINVDTLPTFARPAAPLKKPNASRSYNQDALRTNKDAALLLDGLTATWGRRTDAEVEQ